MAKKARKISAFLGIVFAFLLKANFVLALEITYPSIFGHSVDETTKIGDYLCYFYGLIINAAFTISAIIIAWGGIYYLVSYGRGKFTSEAKDIVKAGIYGLLLCVLASLIAVTINSSLTTCKFGILSALNFNSSEGSIFSSNVPKTIYQEVPIGTLTENLLTKTMDSCFAFDSQGNPIDGNPSTKDRADCLAELMTGVENKSKMVSALATKISGLMGQCSCEGKCDASCGGASGCNQPSKDDCKLENYKCSGSCIGGSCTQKENSSDCCPAGVKDKIEHGPIEVTLGNASGTAECNGKAATFSGLDEFRCPNPISGEHSSCDDIKSFVQNGDKINKDNWDKLNLLQQMKYFQIKINEINADIKSDKILLKSAADLLQSKQCYLSIPYVDFAKVYQQTNEGEKIVLKSPFLDFNKQPVSISKYCTGYNYADSACLKKCSDLCPDYSNQALQLFGSCQCQPGDKICIEKCIEKAYSDRPCTKGDSSQNFGTCITSCQNDCKTNCEKLDHSKCSSQYNECTRQCDNDSQCISTHEDYYFFGAENFAHCGSKNIGSNYERGNASYCIDNAYNCKNGSDNYSVEGNPYQTGTVIESKCPTIPNGCGSGTQCNQYSYNDDPLTFYCENNWMMNPDREDHNAKVPIGQSMTCSFDQEIPVGQTVDDAQNWADQIILNSEKIQGVTVLMEKAGKAKDDNIVKDYCKCNAKDEKNKQICVSDCKYDKSACSCTFVPCKGNSCKQVADYLQELASASFGLNGTFAGKQAAEILAGLSYSRNQTNKCSVVANNYPGQQRLLNCSRVEDELIPPVNGGQVKYGDKTFGNLCYGIELGKAVNKNMTNNWFCCQAQANNPNQNK